MPLPHSICAKVAKETFLYLRMWRDMHGLLMYVAQLPAKLRTPWLCPQYCWTPWLCIIVWTKPVTCNSKYLLMRAIQAETNKKWQRVVSKMCNMQNPGITMHGTSKTEKSFCICMKNVFYSWSIYSQQQSSSVTHTHVFSDANKWTRLSSSVSFSFSFSLHFRLQDACEKEKKTVTL